MTRRRSKERYCRWTGLLIFSSRRTRPLTRTSRLDDGTQFPDELKTKLRTTNISSDLLFDPNTVQEVSTNLKDRLSMQANLRLAKSPPRRTQPLQRSAGPKKTFQPRQSHQPQRRQDRQQPFSKKPYQKKGFSRSAPGREGKSGGKP